MGIRVSRLRITALRKVAEMRTNTKQNKNNPSYSNNFSFRMFCHVGADFHISAPDMRSRALSAFVQAWALGGRVSSDYGDNNPFECIKHPNNAR